MFKYLGEKEGAINGAGKNSSQQMHGHECNKRAEEAEEKEGAISGPAETEGEEEEEVKELNLKNWSLHVLNFNTLSILILHWPKKLGPEYR